MTSTPATEEATPTGQTAARTDHNLWPGVTYDDAPAARKWLADLGFVPGIAVPGSEDNELIHSEMVWPEGGRVMVSSRGRTSEFTTAPGSANIYVVCDEPDAVFDRAQALEAPIVRPMEDTDYGSRGFSIRDVEGNIWSFGTYAGG